MTSVVKVIIYRQHTTLYYGAISDIEKPFIFNLPKSFLISKIMKRFLSRIAQQIHVRCLESDYVTGSFCAR